MKLNINIGSRVAGWLAIIALVAWAASAEAASGFAKVLSIKGQPQYTTKGSTAWKNLIKGDVLKEGDRIKTDAKSSVLLNLDYNNGTMTVNPNSDLSFDKLEYKVSGLEVVHDTQMNLAAGKITGSVSKMAKASKYEVKLPRGVAAVRGTVYSISADGNVTVDSGTVIVTYLPAGQTTPVTFTVGPGKTLDLNAPGGPVVRDATPAERSEAQQQALTAETQKNVQTGTVNVTPQPDPEPVVSGTNTK